ncbi:hypothetical protein [Hyphococcus sp.]|uniref:hypothetical protein n=1 Tax=Hyphococcus sp. TaxID=2038636 RepID=UPI003D0EABB4
MSRILTIIAAIAILGLLIFMFSDRNPAERTALPDVDAPDVNLEDGIEPEAELEVAPREVDPELAVEPMDVDVVRDSEGPPEVEITVPEGEAQIDNEVEDTPDDAALETDETATETGDDDQPPKEQR